MLDSAGPLYLRLRASRNGRSWIVLCRPAEETRLRLTALQPGHLLMAGLSVPMKMLRGNPCRSRVADVQSSLCSQVPAVHLHVFQEIQDFSVRMSDEDFEAKFRRKLVPRNMLTRLMP